MVVYGLETMALTKRHETEWRGSKVEDAKISVWREENGYE